MEKKCRNNIKAALHRSSFTSCSFLCWCAPSLQFLFLCFSFLSSSLCRFLAAMSASFFFQSSSFCFCFNSSCLAFSCSDFILSSLTASFLILRSHSLFSARRFAASAASKAFTLMSLFPRGPTQKIHKTIQINQK